MYIDTIVYNSSPLRLSEFSVILPALLMTDKRITRPRFPLNTIHWIDHGSATLSSKPPKIPAPM